MSAGVAGRTLISITAGNTFATNLVSIPCPAIRPPVRPRYGDAVHAQIGNHLTHVLVGMDQHSQVNTSHRGFLAKEMQAPVELGVACLPDRFLQGLERSAQQVEDRIFSRTLAMISSLR